MFSKFIQIFQWKEGQLGTRNKRCDFGKVCKLHEYTEHQCWKKFWWGEKNVVCFVDYYFWTDCLVSDLPHMTLRMIWFFGNSGCFIIVLIFYNSLRPVVSRFWNNLVSLFLLFYD